MKELAELEGVLLTGKLQGTTDENEDAFAGAGRLAINGGDAMFALRERQGSELGNDGLGTLNSLAFKGEHRVILIERDELRAIGVEDGVVMVNEGPGDGVGIDHGGHGERGECFILGQRRDRHQI